MTGYAFPGFLKRHEVTVEPYLGESAYGPRYGPPVAVVGLLERRIRVVRGQNGEETTSSGTFRTRLDAGADIGAESRVTLPDGTTTTVIAVVPHDGGGLPVPHLLEVQLE
ncbi:hypothetical protein ACIRPR_06560 [Streptomyces griseoflavus]|uniref:hypothetical protein n=1 Tax=Streptomyces griseoflavus TaxID=35619 RepID=UPI0037F2EAF2